jgi:hypothetical protein
MEGQTESGDFDYAIAVVRTVCELAGVPSYVDDLRTDLRTNGVTAGSPIMTRPTYSGG